MRNLLTSVLPALLTVGALHLAAQPASPQQSGFIPVTVTEPHNRFVTGLTQENFAILENGSPRPVTYFANGDSPIALAIISESQIPMTDILKPGDELFPATSLSGAVPQLMASKNQRKAIIVTTGTGVDGIPSGIQVVETDPASALRVAIELRNQYLLRFQRFDPTARVEVVLKPPVGLPVLKPVWTAPF
jgi:hypothetical protein